MANTLPALVWSAWVARGSTASFSWSSSRTS
jgi:hypothetical protein